MNTMRFFPVDPSNLKHIKLLDEYQRESTDCTPIGIYQNIEQSDNDINIELVLEEKSKIQDICHLQGYKDIKSCTLSFVPKKKKQRKIVSLATSYALDTLGMEEVFLKINPEDNEMIKYLKSNKFECLGDEKGSIIFLKEKQM